MRLGMIKVTYAYSTSTYDVIMYHGNMYRIPFDRKRAVNKGLNLYEVSAEYITESNRIGW
jgi:hypothetical protein